MDVLFGALILQVMSGIAALLLGRAPRAATVAGAGGAVAGCVLGLMAAVPVLLGGPEEGSRFGWDAAHGSFAVGVDPLSAFFLVPVLGLGALAAVYGGNYLLAYRAEKSLGPPWFFFNVFVAGMALVLIARTVLLFLVAWEVMSLAAYCLVTFEHEQAEVRRAGWIYLVATHLGVIFLIVAFLLLGREAGSLEFPALVVMPNLSAGLAGLVFVLALVGFGAKAGFVPFHVWLPEAHPAAPSHVSALMSGVMIKMGLYGILRVVTFLGPPAPWWGLTLAGLGLVTGLVGIAMALYQRDIKRVLAYSSIENIGLIALALGVALWGTASGMPVVAALGMTAALLHIWNHALMKGLMFFAAGGVLHGTGTRDMEKLGGLMKRMPWTGSAMLTGAVAIAALPPLNGFVSKWLMYLSLMNCGIPASASRSLTALLAVGMLVLIGGLAALTFVRLIGIVLLGSPRSPAAMHAHESSPWLIGPMQVLICLCLTAAVVPQTMTGALGSVLEQMLGSNLGPMPPGLESSAVPLATVGNVNAWTLLASLLLVVVLLALTPKALQAAGPTWSCGYARPTVRMQYTGRSFAEMIAEHLLPRGLRPRTKRQPPQGLFPGAGKFEAECADPVSQKVYQPFFRHWANRFARLRFLQQGKVHIYLFYIMLMVVLALAWTALRAWWGTA
jgi:hydrogenase-4 component B